MEPDATVEHKTPTAPETAGEARQSDSGFQAWEAYRADLRRFVQRQLHSSQEADDVVQAIYHSLLEYPPRDAIQNPRAWLWRIAWRVLNLTRQRQADYRSYHVAADPNRIEALADRSHLTGVASVETQWEAADELLAALDGLPIQTQVAIVRSRRDGWTNERIGKALGISPHMVKKHIIRALKHFAEYTKQPGKPFMRKEDR